MSDTGPTLAELLCEVAIQSLESDASHLESLRHRLGPDNLSIDEWNALVSAASNARVEAGRHRRDRITYTQDMHDLRKEASFLCERLREHADDQDNDFHGHVVPSIRRLEMILTKLDGVDRS